MVVFSICKTVKTFGKPLGASPQKINMIKRYNVDILAPNWPKWKKLIVNFFLQNIPILHVGRVNRLLAKREHLKNGEFIQAVCQDIGITYELHNGQEIPKHGPVTLVSNHPGGADVVVAIAGIWDYRKDFKILANALICVEPVVDIVIPVDVMRKSEKVDFNVIDEAYQDGNMVVFYAAGKNSRYDEDGKLRDRRWRSSFLDYAYKYKTPLLLMQTVTKNTPLFYKISNFREKRASLKKVPLENMFQLREIFKQKGRKVDMNLSKLIPFEEWSAFYRAGDVKTNRILADRLYDTVYSMDAKNNEFKP